MSRKTQQSSQANDELTTQLSDTNQSEGGYWLSNEFSRLPFQFYKCWLILSFLIFLAIGLWTLYTRNTAALTGGDLTILAGPLPFLYGCGQMFWGIIQRNSKLAQQALSKFNYGTIILVLELLLDVFGGIDLKRGLLRIIIFTIIQVPLFFGGAAVIQAFKKNHPLKRQGGCYLGEDVEEGAKDIFEQNRIIEDEILKYDRELKTCLYLGYRCWFKFVVIFEIIRIVCATVILCIYMYIMWLELKRGNNPKMLKLLCQITLVIIFSSLTLYACYQLESALQKKDVSKSKKALIVLPVAFVIAGIFEIMLYSGSEDKSRTEDFIFWLVFCFSIPMITFFGAAKIYHILEQRDHIAKFSSFQDSSYI